MPKPRKSPERRVHERIKSSIGTNINNYRTSYFSHLRNISRGGAFIHNFAQADYRIGQKVIVTLPAKKNDEVNLVSRIVWMNNDGFGVKFLRYHSISA